MLLYVDEEPEQGRSVLLEATLSTHFTKNEVTTLTPEATLNDMIEKIIDCRCEVLITDYRLNEFQADVQYTGLDLIKEIQRCFEDFPCFLTTNYVADALGELHDINLIFPKADYLNEEIAADKSSQLPFFRRVRSRVEEYREKKRRLEDQFQELYQLSLTKELNINELQDLLNLDDRLERMMGGRDNTLPRLIKEKAIAPFDNLIMQANKLAAEIESELSEKEGDVSC